MFLFDFSFCWIGKKCLVFIFNLKINFLKIFLIILYKFIYFKASQPLQAQFIQKKNKNKN
jgi:hypothetical protein